MMSIPAATCRRTASRTAPRDEPCELLLVIGLSPVLALQQLLQLVRPRQTADVGRENAVRAAFHTGTAAGGANAGATSSMNRAISSFTRTCSLSPTLPPECFSHLHYAQFAEKSHAIGLAPTFDTLAILEM